MVTVPLPPLLTGLTTNLECATKAIIHNSVKTYRWCGDNGKIIASNNALCLREISFPVCTYGPNAQRKMFFFFQIHVLVEARIDAGTFKCTIVRQY